MGKIKTDYQEFTTKRSLKALANDLRRAANAMKAQVQQLEKDALSVDEDQPQIAVLLSGHSFGVGTRMWGVQVGLYDFGDQRVVELIALGDSLMEGIMSYYTGGYFQFSDSKRRREKLLGILMKDDPTARIRASDEEDDHAVWETPPTPAASPQETPAFTGKTKVPAVSPDGVDPLSSPLFSGLEPFQKTDLTQEEYLNASHVFYGNSCRDFAEAHPDFPAGSELKMIYTLGTKEGSKERYIYQPYLDMFPDPAPAVQAMYKALFAWVNEHPDDIVARCLLASGASYLNDFDAANENLYRVLVAESHGANTEDLLAYWDFLAMASGFENWYIEKFGMREANASTQPAKPAPQPASQTANDEPFVSAESSAAGNSAFMPLSANPQGRKIAMVLLEVSLALTLFLVLLGRTSIISLAAPAILFALLFMNMDVDSIPMAIPATINAVLIFLTLVRLSPYGFYFTLIVSFLVDAGIAVVYWLLALKQKIEPQMAAGLLLLLLGIRILMGVFYLLSSFGYGIVNVMSNLSGCLMDVSYFAAVFFASKHMLGQGLLKK